MALSTAPVPARNVGGPTTGNRQPALTAPQQLVFELFATVPHVMVCIKDHHGRYVQANEAFVQRTRCRHPRDVVGRRATDLFPRDLALSYEAQDRSLLATERAVRNQLELISDRVGRSEWFVTTKVLNRHDNHAPSVVAVSVPAQLSGRGGDGLRAAIELAANDESGQLRVSELSAAAQMSADQLERAMRRALGLSPKQHLLRLRADRAATLLATTDEAIIDISARCGYYDQSQLTRQFTQLLGLTPGAYRQLARQQ
jgi:AraC-like DNA-binding protein